nr:hypothetical protein [Tanacetum cinerariifolium]
MDVDDQAIQRILLGLPKDVYAAVDSCEIAKEIWEHVRQMMKGSDIREQEKKAKLFNEWEKFTSTDGESIESYYHRFMKFINDLKRNKHFPENIAANLKFLNNLLPEWKRHVTIVHQTKNLHEADFTQIYDFIKMNQDEVNELRAEPTVRTVLAAQAPKVFLTSTTSTSITDTAPTPTNSSSHATNFPVTLQDVDELNSQQVQQQGNQAHLQHETVAENVPNAMFDGNTTMEPKNVKEAMTNPVWIESMQEELLQFKRMDAFQLTVPTNNNQRTLSNPRNRQIAQPVMNMSQDRQTQNVRGNGRNQFGQYAGQVIQNQQGYTAWQNGIANQNGTGNVVAARAEGIGNGNHARCYNCRGLGHIARNCTARPRRRDAAYLQTKLLIDQKEEAGIQLLAEEFDFMAASGDLDEIEEVNANCILMVNLQHASTSGTQLDTAPVYDTDSSAEVQLNDNCYDNKIFNMFTQEEKYTDLLELILEQQLVPQNDNHVTFVALIDQVAQVNMVNCNMRVTNAELKSKLVRYKMQEQRIEISHDKYDKLEKCYQKSIYQEQCLTRKINALHLNSAKQITTLNDEISNLNKQLSKEKSPISSLMEEKKKLRHDFKTREDKFLDKEVGLEAKFKDLENILLKRDQTVQTMHMLNPKPDSFYHPNQKMALGYPNPSYLKKAQVKQQSLCNGNLLLEEHDPPAVYDSEETLKLAEESREKNEIFKEGNQTR